MKLRALALGGLCISLLATSCKKEEETGEGGVVNLVVSDTYSSDDFENVSTQSVISGLSDISSKMKTADPTNGSNAVTYSELNTIFEAGDPSLKDASSSNYASLADDAMNAFEDASAAGVGNQEFDLATPSLTPDGGYAGDHLFDGAPLELEQIIEKAAYIGALYNHTKNTLFADPSAVTLEQLDQALVLYGSDPTFETKNWTAKYSSARIYTGETTFHDQISYEFRKAQSAINQGFTTDKVDAINAIVSLWEKAIAAQAVYYFEGVASDLAFNPDYENETEYNTVADAIHGWSEGVSFLIGYKGVSGVSISDAQISDVLSHVQYTSLSDSDVLTIVNNPSALAEVNTAISELEEIFGLE